jgi:hypothetical protein
MADLTNDELSDVFDNESAGYDELVDWVTRLAIEVQRYRKAVTVDRDRVYQLTIEIGHEVTHELLPGAPDTCHHVAQRIAARVSDRLAGQTPAPRRECSHGNMPRFADASRIYRLEENIREAVRMLEGPVEITTPHVFVLPKWWSGERGHRKPEETCDVCGLDPRNSIHLPSKEGG